MTKKAVMQLKSSTYGPRKKAGIQMGMTTYSTLVKRSDHFTKMAAGMLARDPDIKASGLVFSKEFTQKELGGKGGKCRATPDGGVWRNAKGEIISIIEAKAQGATGNAFERWYANQKYLTDNGGIRSLTLVCGEGSVPGGTMHREMVGVLRREGKRAPFFNVGFAKGCSFYVSDSGWTIIEVRDIMKRWLLRRITR